MRICYVPKKFTRPHLYIIGVANAILKEWNEAGYEPTLRTLWYYFISADLLPASWIDREYNRKKGLPADTKNTVKNYKKLGSIIAAARLAGRIDWEYIIDATRNLTGLRHFASPADAINFAKDSYHNDLWVNQQYRPEVWIEKDALVGMIRSVCTEWDVPYFSCRGYTSLSEVWAAAERLKSYGQQGYTPFIIHLGDHDPSGIDMSRDIVDRLHKTFMSACEFRRIALTMQQIQEFRCPPNPAKVTDSRYKRYRERFGDDSWELDALRPATLRSLIEDELEDIADKKQLAADRAVQQQHREQLIEVAAEWSLIPRRKAELLQAQGDLASTQIALDVAEDKIKKLNKRLARRKGK